MRGGVALDVGYPDSTHFSHSIRQVYGLTPKSIFAGCRKLALYGSGLQQRRATGSLEPVRGDVHFDVQRAGLAYFEVAGALCCACTAGAGRAIVETTRLLYLEPPVTF